MIRVLLTVFTLTLSFHSFADYSLMDVITAESDVLKFNKSNYSFTLSWQLGPKKGESRFIMRTWKNDLGTMNGPYQSLPDTLHVFLWMPGMGHGSAPVKITKLADGEYDVSNVQFIMGGKWDIHFQMKQGAAVVDEAIVPISL